MHSGREDGRYDMILLKNILNLEMEDGSIPLEVDGWLKVNEDFKIWGGWGAYSTDIITDYTNYITRTIAAHKIQSHWKFYKKKKTAIKTIEKAFISWKQRKDTFWNPYTFAGIADLYVNFIQLQKSVQ